VFHGLLRRRPVKCAGARANLVHVVSMLVHGVWRHE
jgi:hypothetical protein